MVKYQPWSFKGPYRAPKVDLMIFEKILGHVYHFYILYSLAPLTMLEHFFGYCGTLPRLRGPSLTFMDSWQETNLNLQPGLRSIGHSVQELRCFRFAVGQLAPPPGLIRVKINMWSEQMQMIFDKNKIQKIKHEKCPKKLRQSQN